MTYQPATASQPSVPSPSAPLQPAQPDPLEEKILRRIPFEVVAFAAFFAVPVGLIFGVLAGVFFLAGGALAAVGFLWLKSSLDRVLARGKAQALRSGILLYGLRFVLILGVFLIIILLYPKKLLAFGAGFSSVIPVFLGEAVVALARMKTWKV